MRTCIAATLALVTCGFATTAARADHDFDPYTRQVKSWYEYYVHRCADAGGLRQNVEMLRCGTPAYKVEARFIASDEYWHQSGCNPQGFIVAMYRDVCHTTPCENEIRTWLRRYQDIGCRETVACRFLEEARFGGRDRFDSHDRFASRDRFDFERAPVVVHRPTVYVPAPTVVVRPAPVYYTPQPVVVTPRPTFSVNLRFGR